MRRPLTMPQLALGGEDVAFGAWRIEAGAAFAAGEAIAEVETDKATMEVEAPFAGVLVEQLAAPGDTIAVGAVFGQATSEQAAPAASSARSAQSSNGSTAVEHGELAGLDGGLPVAVAPARAFDAERALAGPFSERRLSRQRAAIGRRMALGAAVPSFSVTRTVRAQPALYAVAGSGATVGDVLLLALARAALAHPSVNAWLVDDRLLVFEDVAVALAVDTADGVVAPVLRGAGALDLAGIAAAREPLVARARAGALEARELAGASITLSNAAGLGVDAIAPALTVPQVAAIGAGTARRDWPGAPLVLVGVFDHRALDGADGARFLGTLAEAFEHPTDL